MRPGRNKWMVWVLGMLASWIQLAAAAGTFFEHGGAAGVSELEVSDGRKNNLK